MNKAASFAKLDFLTLKPYYRTYLIFLAIGIVMMYVGKSASMMCFYLIISLGATLSYPFSIGEKNGLDTLYATLSLRKKSIVIGRYSFAVCLELIGILLVLILSPVLSIFTDIALDVREILLYISIASLFFSFMAAVQYPVFFKHGYDKAKYAAYLPLALGFVIGYAVSKAVDIFWPGGSLEDVFRMFEAFPALLYAVPVLLGIVLLAASCALSIRMYAKRDI